jgi:parvulin-like peptidyl-prolyl isomerase
MKTLVIAGLLATSLASARSADSPAPGAAKPPPPAPAPLFGKEIVAKGKGVEITRSQLDDAFIALKGNAAARGQTIPEDQRAQVELRLLDRLIFTQLLLQKATDEERVKGKEAAQKVIQNYKTQARSEEEFTRQLKAMGMSLEQFERQVVEQGICEEVLDREIKDKLTIGDEQVQKFYQDNPADFQQPEMVRAAHILIATRNTTSNEELPEPAKKEKKKVAESVLKRAKSGEDFAKLVKEFSDDPGSKETGGEYTFARAKDSPGRAMVPEFESAAFSLKTNQVSDLVTTKYGYHIIKLNEKIPPKKIELASVQSDIKERLTATEIQKQLPDYLEKLKKEADVKVVQPAGKP